MPSCCFLGLAKLSGMPGLSTLEAYHLNLAFSAQPFENVDSTHLNMAVHTTIYAAMLIKALKLVPDQKGRIQW